MNESVNHIGVIIDGNRRYAKSKNLPGFKGHEAGAEKLKEFLIWCEDLKIKEITAYILSTENLNRGSEEITNFFKLFKEFFKKIQKDKKIHEKRTKIRFIGNLSLVPEDIRQLAKQIEDETKDYDNFKINFCFAYGGRNELVYAINKLIKEGKKEVTEQDITNALWLTSEPQLIIRTGGKIRTSNFLPWQSIYSEWFFLEKMWPEITKQDLTNAIETFQKTARNFGK
jgi:tritrans,polycis-undecaprenyl-diphosphate synthase [geranylgeranyl-diphosphate specific]